METNLYRLFAEYPRVTTDSRNIPEGSLFFALRGARFDGNVYAKQALYSGAAYAIVDDPAVVADHRYILVPDVLAALQQLASEHRQALGLPIIAITGSNGKTTTKELITKVLERNFNVGSTKGNFNNHIGVPLTLLSFDTGTELGVVEMGANNPGEIAALCDIAQPNYGLITNVGLAHLEGFGSPEGVQRAKGELYDYLSETGGKAFVRAEDQTLDRMVHERGGLEVIGYSVHAAEGIENNLVGDYNLQNIAAAVAVGRYFGIAEGNIKEAIADYKPDNMRSQRVETDKNTVILDCYNANPTSMRSAIENLCNETAELPVAVILGDMGELGDYSESGHIDILELLAANNIEEQYLVGPKLAKAASKVPTTGQRKLFRDTDALVEFLKDRPITGRLIMVKGSRATGLEKIAHLL